MLKHLKRTKAWISEFLWHLQKELEKQRQHHVVEFVEINEDGAQHSTVRIEKRDEPNT